MPINIQKLEQVIQNKLALTTSDEDIFLATKSLISLKSSVINTCYTLSILPDAKFCRGQIWFVESENQLYTSDGIAWRPQHYIARDTLWVWGDNFYGSIGDGTSVQRVSPVTTAGGGTNWSWVSAGYNRTSAIKSDGTLWIWGFNNYGRLGDGTTTNRSSPVTTLGGGTNWSQVSCSDSHTVAIKTDGTLWTWGNNSYGQLGDGTATSKSSPVTTAGGGTTWMQISCNTGQTSAVKTDGTLWTWGNNTAGELGNNTATTISTSSPGTTAGSGTNWMQVSSGWSNTLAIKTDGTLWTWGRNALGQLGTNDTVSRSSPGTTSGGGTNWSQVSGGLNHSAAIKTDGSLWTWGLNSGGRLGDGTTTNRSSPGTTAGGGTNWNQVSCGDSHTSAIKTDGTLWTWGVNGYGRLGDGTTTSRSSPGTTAGGGTNWSQVSSGKFHMAAINAS